MPFINAAGTRLYYRLEGREDRPIVVLSHSLGCDHGMWDPQVPALLPHFRVLRYDTRGHGASSAPAGDYTIEELARDVLAVTGALGIARFAFCGLSLGGMIGQWLGAHAGERLTHLVLANTSPRFPDPGVMEARRRAVLEGGMAAVADGAMQRFFSPRTLAGPAAAGVRHTLLSTDPAGYAASCAAIRDMDQTATAGLIRPPVLIVAGQCDVSTPWTGHGDVLARALPHARIARLDTAHLSNLERPRSFNAALLDFLAPLQDGMTMRRAMLGDPYVDQAVAAATDFTRDFQELIARYAWGGVWTRPGLDTATRRLLTLAITAALGRSEEFRLHARTGLERELEPCDLKEVLLQVAIYAGVPAANTAFRLAAEEMRNG